MNTHVQIDQYAAWRHALKTGTPVPFEPGNPASGFYKVRDLNSDRSIRWDACAFWRDDDGLQCSRTGPRPAPTHFDEIEALFASCNSTPITHELFQHIFGGGAWPDEVETPAVETKPDAAPHEALEAKLTALRDQASAWIKAIGAVKTKDDADKAANYADAFAKLEKRATEQHKAEKAPHLEAGRAVDAAWKPLIDRAGECKAWSKKTAEAFLIAEKRRLAEEQRLREVEAAKGAAEAERLRRDAEAAGAPPPVVEAPAPPPPVAQKAKAGTAGRAISVRSRTVHNIVDRRAFLEYLAALNDHPRELLDVMQLLANRMRAAGITVPGVETNTIEEVA